MVAANAEALLPARRQEQPHRFRVGAIDVDIEWVGERVWQLNEQLGATRVVHRHLHQRVAHYEVMKASGV